MKILQLVTKRQYRGAEIFAANLSEELIKLGHTVHFVGLYRNEENELVVEGAENLDLVRARNGSFSVSLIFRLVRIIRTHRYDIVQCNGSDTLKYMVAASFFFLQIPILYRNISMISEWVDNPAKKFLYRMLFKRVNHVSSVGQEAIEDFVKTFDYPENQTSVIRRGIPLKELGDAEKYRRAIRRELGLQMDDKIAIHIGNFSPEKNHQLLLHLFEEIKQDDEKIKLVCVGNGVLFDQIKKEVRRRGLEDTIFLLGFRKDIPELISGSDCFVLSSKVEGVPGVILEAASQKIPSIATKVGGVSEVLKDGETGYLIENFDLREFKTKLLGLMKDEEERKRLGRSAYSLVSEKFNPRNNSLRFEELYYKISGEKVRSHGNQRPLKVLQIIQQNQFRGAEVFCNQLSSHLLNLGLEVEILNLFEGKATFSFRGTTSSLRRPKSLRYFDIPGWKKLSDYIRDFDPDIIQANAADTLKYAVLAKFFFRWKVPIIYRNASTSSFYVKGTISRKFNSFLLKKVDHIASVAEASKTDLNEMYPFTVSKSTVIPVGIENREVKRSAVIEDGLNLLHIGSFTKEKNHSGLLRIFQKVVQWNGKTKLYLLGEGPLKDSIFKQAQDLGIGGNIIFLEVIPDPLPILKSSNLLVLPSVTEGMPGVLLEAMYVRTPVVAYDVGGISEIVNGKTGTLVPMGDEEAFFRAIKKNLLNPDPLKIENGYNMVIQEHTNESIAKRFLLLYRKIIKKEPKIVEQQSSLKTQNYSN